MSLYSWLSNNTSGQYISDAVDYATLCETGFSYQDIIESININTILKQNSSLAIAFANEFCPNVDITTSVDSAASQLNLFPYAKAEVIDKAINAIKLTEAPVAYTVYQNGTITTQNPLVKTKNEYYVRVYADNDKYYGTGVIAEGYVSLLFNNIPICAFTFSYDAGDFGGIYAISNDGNNFYFNATGNFRNISILIYE